MQNYIKHVNLLLLGFLAIWSATALSACAQLQNEAALEATVVAMVDARLTEVATGVDSSNEQTQVTSPNATGTQEPNTASVAEQPAMLITPTPDRSNEIMAIILGNTRHFKGDPEAPVTIVEFSDFQ